VKRAVFALLMLGGCAPDNNLSGSMGELFPLDVSNVQVYRNAYAVQVSYYANRGLFLDVVIRMTVATAGIDVKDGAKINLAGEYDTGHQRTEVAHAPGGEPVRILPNVKRGDLKLDQIGIGPVCDYDAGLPDGGIPCTAPDTSRGNFSILFADDGSGDIGSGRTLVGTFVAPTYDAGFGPLP
jgi:hypothetical protein